MTKWNPEQYERFLKYRTQFAIDLLSINPLKCLKKQEKYILI